MYVAFCDPEPKLMSLQKMMGLTTASVVCTLFFPADARLYVRQITADQKKCVGECKQLKLCN